MSGHDSVVVEAAARLHFGVLDLRGALGRRFGGLGAAVPAPSLLLEVEPDSKVSGDGPDGDRAQAYAERFLAFHRIAGGARLTVHRSIPPHSGLGSGTQLALSVARALAEIYGLPMDAPSLARAVGRGRRSAIGTWTFALGGFIVEGGRRPDAQAIAPLLARYPIPDSWRCVVAVPAGAPGLSGEAEAAAFDRLPVPAEREVERVAHLVLMQLLPALVEADLASFGAALTEVQRVTGGWFASEQGGVYAPGPTVELVARLSEWGAEGVGQSSWGPAVYGFTGSQASGLALAGQAREFLGSTGQVFEGGFAGSGATVRRAERAGIRD
jgi:beta-ribofuranosylaminobenzene 5'-phosphate synthase